MQNIRWVSFVPPNPVCDVFSESATDLGIETHNVIFTERLQSRFGPFSHRNHDRLLVHFEMAGLVELQTPLPRIPKTIWPFAWITILFVPDKFFRPEPTLLAKRQNQFQYKCVTFAILGFFFDVQDEGSRRLENSKELLAARKK